MLGFGSQALMPSPVIRRDSRSRVYDLGLAFRVKLLGWSEKSGNGILQVEEAAKLANAHEFISAFPLGYRTPVGERGSFLFLSALVSRQNPMCLTFQKW